MKTAEEYLALPYTMIVRWSPDDELYVARVKEIEGCTAHGDSEVDALNMLRDNLRAWVEFALESGDKVPVPKEDGGLPSGKWLQRVPRSLHASLVEAAEADQVSLNQLVVSILAKEIGNRQAKDAKVVGRIAGSGTATTDTWGTSIHLQTSRWQVEVDPTNTSIDMSFVKTLLRDSSKKSKTVCFETRDHGKNEETIWN